MLIVGAEIAGQGCCVRIEAGRVAALAPTLTPFPGEKVVAARGGALIPSLNDHHIHLFATAAALASVDCGAALTQAALFDLLGQAARAASGGWVRGIGYYEGAEGLVDRAFLDACTGDTPVRIQHRSGRLWILNSAALERLLAAGKATEHLEREGAWLTGRLFDSDEWLHSRLASRRPDLRRIGLALARRGVTGVTDAGHSNDPATYRAIGEAKAEGEFAQEVLLLGRPDLATALPHPGLSAGAVKFHLHDGALPDADIFTAGIAQAHRAGRGVAVHCVTDADLILTLSCIEEAGSNGLDRIEHASVTPPVVIDWMARLGVTVVTQPHFIAERGDSYLASLPPLEIDWLYRAGGLAAAGIPLAAGSDAPYGRPDPWASMQAAVDRRTQSGRTIGADLERLTPEASLGLYTSSLEAPGRGGVSIVEGAAADLCLLDRPWSEARGALADVRVRLTLKAGEILWDAAEGSVDDLVD